MWDKSVLTYFSWVDYKNGFIKRSEKKEVRLPIKISQKQSLVIQNHPSHRPSHFPSEKQKQQNELMRAPGK